jgi:excinuclease ABC subunit B
MSTFKITSQFEPTGDQPKAIKALSRNILDGKRHNVLLGVTGSGKTFAMAHVIANVNKPTLVIAPNKTLAAQLYNEFKQLFPENAVEYFVSYYDYYQPEAYIPSTDTYIQKDSSINDMIDKLRHSATRSVLSRRDIVVVASVSCIFGLGAPEDYLSMRIDVQNGTELNRDQLLFNLISMHYTRNDIDFYRGVFRVRGDRVEIFPAYEENNVIRIDFFGDHVEGISEIDALRGKILRRLDRITIFPASHYVTEKAARRRALETIVEELKKRVQYFRDEKKLIEAQRIEERTNFDLEMIQELGYCNGIENYSRAGSPGNHHRPCSTTFRMIFFYLSMKVILRYPSCTVCTREIDPEKKPLLSTDSGYHQPWIIDRCASKKPQHAYPRSFMYRRPPQIMSLKREARHWSN